MANIEKLKRLFPRASKAFIEVNTDAGLQDTQPERSSRPALDSVLQREKASYARAHVCITAFTVRPRDPDNLGCGCKALIDACRRLNLIKDDDPYSIGLEIKQRHVEKFEQEKTLLEIEYR